MFVAVTAVVKMHYWLVIVTSDTLNGYQFHFQNMFENQILCTTSECLVIHPLVFTLPHPPDTATVVGWRVQLVCSLDIWVPLTSTSLNSGRSFSSWARSDLFNFGKTSQLVTEIPLLTWSTF